MLITTRHWMARNNGDNRIAVQQKRDMPLSKHLLAELDSMRKLCFAKYDLHIEAHTNGRVVCAFVRHIENY